MVILLALAVAVAAVCAFLVLEQLAGGIGNSPLSLMAEPVRIATSHPIGYARHGRAFVLAVFIVASLALVFLEIL